MLKSAFVSVACEEISKSGHEPNISRVNAAIGLHRRDVTRLMTEGETIPDTLSYVVRVLGHWQTDRRFSRNGRGHVLTCEGSDSQFHRLVQSVSKDLKPVTVLSELERAGAVVRKNGKVKLVRRAFVPQGDVEATLKLFARDASQFLEAVEENSLRRSDLPHLHARTHYDRIISDAAPEIRKWLMREGSALHQRARNYLSRFDVDINPTLGIGKEVIEVSLGTFSLVKSHDDNAEE